MSTTLKRFTAEQVVQKLREAEVELAKGRKVGEVCRQIGIFRQTSLIDAAAFDLPKRERNLLF